MAACMPRLKERWAALTWTGVGLQLESLLKEVDSLPAVEDFLARHVAGFIRDFLWSSAEMTDGRLDFDDVALLRAFAYEDRGKACEARVNSLVDSLVPTVNESGVGFGKADRHSGIFGTYNRCCVWRRLTAEGEIYKTPMLIAGVEGDYLIVWLESRPRYGKKEQIWSVVDKYLKKLRARQSDWSIPEPRSEWWDLMIETPLTDLLSSANQQEYMQQFVRRALGDLRETGFFAALAEALKK
jgi:hypothetical protein